MKAVSRPDTKKKTNQSLRGGLVRATALVLASFTVIACAGTKPPPVVAVAPAPDPASITASAIKSLIDAKRSTLSQPDRVLAFYEARNFRAAWTGEPDEERIIADVRSVFTQAYKQGLKNEDYRLPASGPRAVGMEAAEYDVAVTDMVLRYSRDVRNGRFRPNDIYQDVKLPAPAFDPAAGLNGALKDRSLAAYLAWLPPPHPEYGQLAQALAHYRAIADEGGWPTIEGQNEIKLQSKDPRIPVLIKRLTFEDPKLDAIARPTTAQLRDAVKRFQARNGLEQDGVVGSGTIAALNVSASDRVDEIAANMERWRWLPPVFEHRYVAVNVPDQSVSFMLDGKVALTSRVVVGRKTLPTPIVRTAIMTVVVNPPWNIPGDIAARDLLPRLRQNANYLQTRNMVLMNGPPNDPYGRTVKWREIVPAEFPYAIRQLPGPATALGAVMLDSPNDFDVYLHDTPNKDLFKLDDREISNGCVRVQQIFPLASLALTNDTADGMGTLNEARKTGETQRIKLSDPLPLYFLYWTASANAEGEVEFRPDRYSRDVELIAVMKGERPAATSKKPTASDPAQEMNPDEELAP